MDRDLQSIQAVRDLVGRAVRAQRELAGFSQQQLDAVCEAVARAGAGAAERLARLAVEETGYGVVEDKTLKNLLGSTMTWDSVRDLTAVGLLAENREARLLEVGVPVGVVAALVPSTNPTSTVLYKAIIALKAGNAIVFSPHPGAKGCIAETVRLAAEAAEAAGAPPGSVGCLTLLTKEATGALLGHPDVGMILATGGGAMVRAAYSSGNPAIGVGPGNGPAFIERTADIPLAVGRILASKTFDNGTICASEQSIVTERCAAPRVEEELARQGGHFLTEEQSRLLADILLLPGGAMNPRIVGRTAAEVAALAGIPAPEGVRVLLSRQDSVSADNPYAREKLCPVLGYYVEEDWEAACRRCIEILHNEGAGHTMVIHSENREVIREFAFHKPVSRLLVNTPAALGGVGATTNLPPALTLGCGAAGGSATGDNVTPLHLVNIRRTAWGVRELEDLRGAVPAAGPSAQAAPAAGKAEQEPVPAGFSRADVDTITRAVMERLAAMQQ